MSYSPETSIDGCLRLQNCEMFGWDINPGDPAGTQSVRLIIFSTAQASNYLNTLPRLGVYQKR